MLGWSEADVVAFFESGGQTRPRLAALFIHTVADLHVEHKANAAWLERLPDGSGSSMVPGSVLLCCGDLATSPDTLRSSFRRMRRAYEYVFFTPGNHDVWVTCKSAPDSLAKYRNILQMCSDEGVHTRPVRLRPPSGVMPSVWIVPLASWHHASWDREPPLQPPPGMALAIEPRARHASSDGACCVWPAPLEHGSAALAAAIDGLNDEPPPSPPVAAPPTPTQRPPLSSPCAFAEALAAITVERTSAAAANTPQPVVLSLSHMLPRQELLPVKRHLFMPTLHEIVGSDYLASRVATLRPDMHCFGHTHFAWVSHFAWELNPPGFLLALLLAPCLPRLSVLSWLAQRCSDSNPTLEPACGIRTRRWTMTFDTSLGRSPLRRNRRGACRTRSTRRRARRGCRCLSGATARASAPTRPNATSPTSTSKRGATLVGTTQWPPTPLPFSALAGPWMR